MITQKYLPKSTDTWRWSLMQSGDLDEVVALAVDQYQSEVEGLLTPSPRIFRYNLELALCEQQFQLSREQVIIARHNQTQELMAYAWCRRGQYTPYSTEEMAEAAIAHVQLHLPDRVRVRILAQMLQQWILWCQLNNIPVLVSSSIRQEQTAFMRLHEQFGFRRVGLLAIKRIRDSI